MLNTLEYTHTLDQVREAAMDSLLVHIGHQVLFNAIHHVLLLFLGHVAKQGVSLQALSHVLTRQP